ncbi:MAG: hypothetical protein JW751_25115 [Polyangiaceae bacterium]|nr:hypothetical protein [Polyangiaceae bacterium]
MKPLPLVDLFLPRVLPECLARDVVGRRHGEEEHEQQEEHTDDGDEPIGDATDDVGQHLLALPEEGQDPRRYEREEQARTGSISRRSGGPPPGV